MKELIAIFRRIFGMVPIAYGKDVYGDTFYFKCKYRIADFYTGQMTELTIPKGVTYVDCCDNQLTELKLPEGVTYVDCSYNQITHLTLPESVTELRCDKEVTGLEKHVGKVTMKLR